MEEYMPEWTENILKETLINHMNNRLLDVFNIRGYERPLNPNEWDFLQGRNLINANDTFMYFLREYLIYTYLTDILWISFSQKSSNEIQIQSYSRLNWSWFEFKNPTIYTPLNNSHSFDKYGTIFPNGSLSNQYIIEHITQKNKNECIMIGEHTHIPSIPTKNKVVYVEDSESHQEIIEKIKKERPCLLIATFGTTNFWANDSRIMNKELCEYCKDHNIFIHIDMAYASHYLSKQQKDRLNKNHTYIYSIMTDPHKMISWLGCSLLLFPNGRIQENENNYFRSFWTEAWTSLDCIPTYQAVKFLIDQSEKSLETLKQDCLKKANIILKIFENLWYNRFWDKWDYLQYPNIAIEIWSEKQRDYIIKILNKQWITVAKIDQINKYGIRIFVSPTIDFSDENMSYLTESFKWLPQKECFVNIDDN